MKARYSPRDPRWEVWCLSCSTSNVHDCAQTIEIPAPSIIAGSYRCGCFRCRCQKKVA